MKLKVKAMPTPNSLNYKTNNQRKQGHTCFLWQLYWSLLNYLCDFGAIFDLRTSVTFCIHGYKTDLYAYISMESIIRKLTTYISSNYLIIMGFLFVCLFLCFLLDNFNRTAWKMRADRHTYIYVDTDIKQIRWISGR